MIPQFAISLICGLALTWCLMPRRQVTSGFFRIQNLLTLGMSVLAYLTAPQLYETAWPARWLSVNSLRGLAAASGAISFVSSVLWTLERRQAATAGAFLLLGLSLAMLLGLTPRDYPLIAPTTAGAALSSAWLIGASMGAMLLGHWYLTATGMPLAPLVRLNWLYLAAALTRGAFAAGFLATGPAIDWSAHGVWLGMRWGAGIVGPLVMAVLVFRILRYRNTQSATGVLFAAVILVFMGEMAATLLTRDRAWPA